MARRAIVSRTVVGTEVSVLGLNIETAEPENKTYVLSGSFTKTEGEGDAKKTVLDEKKLLKAVQKSYDTDTFKNIKIVDTKPVNTLYGMWEEDFIAHAFQLDPVTRKPLDDEEGEAEE